MRLKIIVIMAFILMAGSLIERVSLEAAGGSLPPWPLIYTGNVYIGGEPAPDGVFVVGVIGEYNSIPVEVKDGRVVGMAVGPPDVTFFGQTIRFELRSGDQVSIAEETDLFTNLVSPTLRKDFHLNFPGFPTPTPLPTATPTATPLPTSTPLATATPIVVGPVVYNGVVVVSAGAIPENSTLTARIGGYESRAVPVTGGEFISLILDVNDPLLTNKEVTFYLNGFLSRTTAIYSVGDTIRNVDLIFMDLPEAVSVDAGSPPVAPPTTVPMATEVPVVLETATSVPVVAPVATVVPAPSAPLETPTPIVLVVTATPEAEVAPAAEAESGGCMAVSEIDPLTGSANVLAMIGPVLLLVAFRGYRKLF